MNFWDTFDDRDLAFFLFDFPDYDAQLAAIRSMIRLRKQADDEFDRELKEIEEFAKRARASERAVDVRVDHLHGSVFQDAAHSMAAVGMLAPFFESLFTQAFFGIERLFQQNGQNPSPSPRWTLSSKKKWNCHYIANGEKDLIKGIFELAELTDLAPHLPRDLKRTLDALIGYRNQNFHNGFEWPLETREKFEKRIKTEAWPESWFERSKSGGKPWIIYLSHDFVSHCLSTVEQVLEGLGAFVRRVG